MPGPFSSLGFRFFICFNSLPQSPWVPGGGRYGEEGGWTQHTNKQTKEVPSSTPWGYLAQSGSCSSPTSRTSAPHSAQSSVGAPSALSSDISILFLLPLQQTAIPSAAFLSAREQVSWGLGLHLSLGTSPSLVSQQLLYTQLALEGRAFLFSRVLVSQLGCLYFWSSAW